jgi:hypothetical protein
VTLNAANVFTNLGAFTTGGNYAFSLTDAHDLTVTGAVNAGTGALTLTTTGSGNDIIVNNTLHGGTVKLASAATIASNSSGKITATTLTGSSHGTVTLNAANKVTNLGAFTTNNGGFALTDAQALTVTGAANTGTGTLSLKTTSGNLTLKALVTAKTTTLISAAKALESGAGAIHTTTLNVTAVTGIILSGANVITHIGTNHTGSGTDIINH